MAVVKEYFELTKKYQEDYGINTIVLMQVGSFFEVYGLLDKNTNTISGSQILDFSRICDLAVVEKNVCVGKNDVVMAGHKDLYIEKYVKKIQDAGFTAVVYTQDEAAKNTTRSLAGIFSPGTYFSNESTKLTNNLTCIWIDVINNKLLLKGKYVVVGIANIDIYTGKTSVFQFKETYINNPTTYDELERFISIYNPSEVIFISNLPENEVNDVISFTNINCASIHKINVSNTNEMPGQFVIRAKNCEKQIYQKEVIGKFYKVNDIDVFIQNFYDNNIAAQAFCFLLDFVYQHNPRLVNQVSEPIFENCSDRLILANHSLKQLNILDDNNYSGKYSSVLKMLNECLTPMGKRKFNYIFLNPTTKTDYLKTEYDITEYMIQTYDLYSDFLKNNLSNIKDISKWERQVFLKKISPKAFYSLYNNIAQIKTVYDKIVEDDKINKYLQKNEVNTKMIGIYCDKITNYIKENLNIQIAKEIDSSQNFETNFIQPGVDIDLDNKTQLLKESEAKLEAIRKYLNSLVLDKGKTSEFIKIHETEKNNFSLICTSRRCKLLETSLPSEPTIVKLTYDIDNTKHEFNYKICKKQLEYKNHTSSNNYIIDDEIVKICKNISSIKISLKDTITLVFNKIVEVFESYQAELEGIISFITLTDLLYAKSTIAKKYNYCKPTLCESSKSFVNIKGLRHSLIEQIQTSEIYVSNDIILGDGNIDGILLYGTNAVGKTSLIRALGIAVIMAQSGFYVPCTNFIYKPYNYIFTRILGNDNIFKGLSTFAVEMYELRTILRLADENSLILGDELCSGTENTSAVSIFVAGIQRLYHSKSSYIFATHLHEIVNYEEITCISNLVLKHMEVIYDKERDILIYNRKLKDGSGSSMYGLEVCKALQLPEDFLSAAYNIRNKYHPESGSVLDLKTSHYNARKIMGLCEKCGKNMGTEVHHLQHQADANEDGIILNEDAIFHKNNAANLMTLCESCHNNMHKVDHKKHTRRIKTTRGYTLSDDVIK